MVRASRNQTDHRTCPNLQDAICFEGQWHCNAHSNNVVVLSEAQAAQAAKALAAAQAVAATQVAQVAQATQATQET